MMELSEKVIIVTGGSGLLGKTFIEMIQRKGGIAINADVNILTNIDEGFVHCDISDEGSLDALIRIVLKKYKRIDGLVNNAYPRTSDWALKFEDIPLESWRKNVDMQMNSCFSISRRVLEVMKSQKFGSVINIASIYGVVGPDFYVYGETGMTMPAAYSAIKGGIITFTKYLASYYGQYNIRINTISPGGIANGQSQDFIDRYESKVPLKRMGTPEDIAPSVSFLLSDGSSYITGHNLIVDGGWTII